MVISLENNWNDSISNHLKEPCHNFNHFDKSYMFPVHNYAQRAEPPRNKFFFQPLKGDTHMHEIPKGENVLASQSISSTLIRFA